MTDVMSCFFPGNRLPGPLRPADIHPNWIAHFAPDNTYVGPELLPEASDDDAEEGELRTYSYRVGEVTEEVTYRQPDYRTVLTDMGF